MPDTAFLLALLAAILAAASLVLHVVAPRTKNTVDDTIRDDVDELLAFMRGQSPQNSTPPRDPQAGSVRRSLAALLAVLGVPLLVLACTVAQARQTAATGTVAALDCELVHVDQAVLDDLRHVAEGKVQAWISGAAPANMGALIDRVKADLGVFKSDAGRCAIAGALAAATTIASPTPGEAVQGLTVAPTRPDPVAVRAAFSTAARELGLPPLKVAGGTTL
jgi:hypothetical protein